MEQPLLQVENLSISYEVDSRKIQVVRNLHFSIERGETLAIVGESGSGKTATALSVIGLLPDNGQIDSGKIYLNGNQLIGQAEKDWEKIRGQQIAMIFQDPMSALNPVLTIGQQIEEVMLLRKEHRLRKDEIRQECISLLNQVGVTEPSLRLKQYPHQLSGGIRQRVMIAIALASKPKLLIADEPTTALDSTVKKQILALLAELKKKLNLSILLITHDLAETVMLADKVMVMYAGKAIEFGGANSVFEHPQHPYTKALIQAIPRMEDTKKQRLIRLEGQPPSAHQLPTGCAFHPRCPFAKETCKHTEPLSNSMDGRSHFSSCWLSQEEKDKLNVFQKSVKEEKYIIGEKIPIKGSNLPVLEIENIKMHFQVGRLLSREKLKAVDGISLTVQNGEITAIVGESGSGKTTLWQTIVGFNKPTSGTVHFLGKKLNNMREKQSFYRQIGFVFQNSNASLNPRMSVGESILEPLRVANWKASNRKKRLLELLELVGLPLETSEVLPHQLSGGQRQRVAIARAIAVNPKLVVLDEPVSSLDVSIQAQIINLLKELQEKLNISMLFISHDLALVKYFANKVIVLYGGKIVEEASCDELFLNPKHPYSQMLIESSTPSLETSNKPSEEVSSLIDTHEGCAFQTRCSRCLQICTYLTPTLTNCTNGHRVACHLFETNLEVLPT